MNDRESDLGSRPGIEAGKGGDVSGPTSLFLPEQRIGSFLLVERLGAGGVGEVWKARDRRLNRIVALKFLAPGRSGTSPPRDLLREARAASALNHPNIITIFEVGESDSAVFLAMEFIEGETLRARLKRPPIPLDETLEIAIQMATGMATAHRQGIIHRDLKPENIMLRVDGLVKLLDFGLAKVVRREQQPTAEFAPGTPSTETGMLTGTLTYMSPEQARGLPLTPASDVFSFGIVLYEMLTGEHPFRAETPMDTLAAILAKEPPELHLHRPAIPAEIRRVCRRALEKETSRRYPSALELGEGLKQAKTAPSAPSPAPLPQLRHRPRWMQAIGAGLIAILLTLAAWRLGGPAAGDSVAIPVQSVAVMNFRTAPEDQPATLIAQDLPEQLGGSLSKAGLLVASRSSMLELGATAKPRDVGAQFGVDAVLAGNVRSYGSKFKVYVELVNTRTGFQIWSETFTVEAGDLLSGEQKTAADITEQLCRAVTTPK